MDIKKLKESWEAALADPNTKYVVLDSESYMTELMRTTMTINESWIVMHGQCIGSSVSENGQDVVFHCPVHKITLNEKAPYPFCRTPRKCAGVGTCRREYACND